LAPSMVFLEDSLPYFLLRNNSNAQRHALDGILVLQEVHRGLHVSDDLEVCELPARPLHPWLQTMGEIGCHGGIADGGQPGHHGADKRIDAPPPCWITTMAGGSYWIPGSWN